LHLGDATQLAEHCGTSERSLLRTFAPIAGHGRAHPAPAVEGPGAARTTHLSFRNRRTLRLQHSASFRKPFAKTVITLATIARPAPAIFAPANERHAVTPAQGTEQPVAKRIGDVEMHCAMRLGHVDRCSQ
jgi:hypothetical protein